MEKLSLTVLAVLIASLSLWAVASCRADDYETLVGSYRVIWDDGSPNDHVFKIERQGDRWFMSDDDEGFPLWKYERKDRIEEEFAERLHNESLLDAPCLDSWGASRLRICAVKSGEVLIWRQSELTVSTGYFLFDGDYIFFQLEKLP